MRLGMMNIAMPSIVIKMMRRNFDQQSSALRNASLAEQAGAARLREASLAMEARFNRTYS